MSRPYFHHHRPNHLEQPRYFPPHHHHHNHHHNHNPHQNPNPNPNRVFPRPVPVDRHVYHPVRFTPPTFPPPPLLAPPPQTPYRSTLYHHPQSRPLLDRATTSSANGLPPSQHRPFIDKDNHRFFFSSSSAGDPSRVRPGCAPTLPPVFNREIYPTLARITPPVYESDDIFRGLNVQFDDYPHRQRHRCMDQVIRSGDSGGCSSVMSMSGDADNFEGEASFPSDNRMLRRDIRDRFNGRSGFQGEADEEYEFPEVLTQRKRKYNFQESGGYDSGTEFREKTFNCFKSSSSLQSVRKKKSALLRLKVPEIDCLDMDGSENHSNECIVGSIKGADSSYSFSGDCDEGGNDSLLDVSIKSNVLMAKANITPSSIVVVSDTDLSPKLVEIESPRPPAVISRTLCLSKHEESDAGVDSPVGIFSDNTISTRSLAESESGAHRVQADEMNSCYDKTLMPHEKNVAQICGENHTMSLSEEGEISGVKEGNTDVCQKLCDSVNAAAVVNSHGMTLPIKNPEKKGTSMSPGKSLDVDNELEFVNADCSSHFFSETSMDCARNIQNSEGFNSVLGSMTPEKASHGDAEENETFGNIMKTRNFLQGSPNVSDHDVCGFYSNKLSYGSDGNTTQPEVPSPISLGGLYSDVDTSSASGRGLDSINIFDKEYPVQKNASGEFKSLLLTEVSKSIISTDESAHPQFDRSENVFCRDNSSNLRSDEHNNLELGSFQPGCSNKTVEVNENENPVGMSVVCSSKDRDDLLIEPQSHVNETSVLRKNSSDRENNAANNISKHDLCSKSNSKTARKKSKKRAANNPTIYSSLQKFNRESKQKPVNRDPAVQISPDRLTDKHPIKMPLFDAPLQMFTSDQDCLKLDTCLTDESKNIETAGEGVSFVLGTTQKENTNSMMVEEPHMHINMGHGNEHDALHVSSNQGLITEDIKSIKQMSSRIDGVSVAFVKDDAPSALNFISLSSNFVGESGYDTDPVPNDTPNVVSPENYNSDSHVPVIQEKKTNGEIIIEENISKECKSVHEINLKRKPLVSDSDMAWLHANISSITSGAATDPGIGLPTLSPIEEQQIQGPGINDGIDKPIDKNLVSSGIPRGIRGNSMYCRFISKRRLPPGNNGRRHTWHRTESSSAVFKKTNPEILNLQNMPQIISKSQCSYIHKGNSLVRKIGPVVPVKNSYSLRSYMSNNSENDIKDNSGPEGIVESMKAPNFHTSKEVDANSELPNIYPVDVLESTCPLEDHILEEGKKTLITPEAATMISEDSLKSPLLCEDQSTENQDEIGGMDTGLPDNDGLTSAKCQPNQFVISSNPSECSNHNSDENNTLALVGYYKSRKNQLIRSADNIAKVSLSGDSLNPDEQVASKSISHQTSKKKRSSRFMTRRNKSSDSFRPWTYNRTHTLPKEGFSLKWEAMFSYLFPWKRTYCRQSMNNRDSRSSSLCAISKELLLTRKRKTIYTKSSDGFSLRKSKVLSIGGSNLKWSKSIERRSRKANECATQAIAEVERKKRQQKSSSHPYYKKWAKNYPSIMLLPRRGERIFRIGSLRYKMDASMRTLQRVEVEQTPPEAEAEKAYVPKRLHIGDDEYVRIGNGNQLIRDPKKRSRAMAKEKIRWSLHTARRRAAKKHMYCQFYTRFGKCKEESSGKCPYIHDPSKIAVCTKFLRGSCSTSNCSLTHRVIPERMPDCSYFLKGLCSNHVCPYRHVNVNPCAPICDGFLRGYCADGDECGKKHNYNCPAFEASGFCDKGSKCKLQHHDRCETKGRRKRKRSGERSRYFGSKLGKQEEEQRWREGGGGQSGVGDVFFENGKLLEYVSLDVSSDDGVVSDEGGGGGDDDVWGVNLDPLIMPVAIMTR